MIMNVEWNIAIVSCRKMCSQTLLFWVAFIGQKEIKMYWWTEAFKWGSVTMFDLEYSLVETLVRWYLKDPWLDYLRFLSNEIEDRFTELSVRLRQRMYFQQDGILYHISRIVTDHFQQAIEENVIPTNSPVR